MRKNLTLFNRNHSYEQSQLALLAVPWSATASFGDGADQGPEIIAEASSQMDFFTKETGDIRDQGICFLQAPDFLRNLSQETRKKALPVIALGEEAPGNFPKTLMDQINTASAQMVKWVYEETKKIHQAGKSFGLVGGDHSTSEGAIRYFSSAYKGDFGLLHIDAHADLRKSYQGFLHSHASVMHNVIHQAYPPSVLVQVGLRDYSEQEYQRIQTGAKGVKIKAFFDSDIKAGLFEGQTWRSFVDAILRPLPEKVYISLDVDGLKPHLFPHTGTPVPGGLSFEQTDYLLSTLSESRRKVIGFDLVETAKPKGATTNNTPDAQAGARLLYKLCCLILQKGGF